MINNDIFSFICKTTEPFRNNHPTQEDVLKVYEIVRPVLEDAHKPTGPYYPAKGNVKKLFDAYFEAGSFFERSLAFPLAEDLYLRWWDAFSYYQLENRQYIYKAGIAMRLVGHYWIQGDMATAFRWALITQADDVLGVDWHGGGGRIHLRTNFGFLDTEVERLNTLASKARDEANTNNNWSKTMCFPEDIVRQLIEVDANFLLRWGISNHEFKLSRAYYQALLDEAINALSNEDKGKSLENLASYLISLLPGCVVRRNVRDKDFAGESDLVVHNLSPSTNLFSDLLGRDFIIECKNWPQKSIKTVNVGYFLHRMQLAHTKFGIMFARSDVSGKANNTSSYALIRRTYHETGNLCIIITQKDLTELRNEEKPSFWKLILRKIEEFRFGKPLYLS